MPNTLTYTCKNGRTVLAKLYHGETYPVTYANRTQAERAAERMGTGWDVGHWGRPFYVVRVQS